MLDSPSCQRREAAMDTSSSSSASDGAGSPPDFKFFQVFGEEQADGAGVEEIQEGASAPSMPTAPALKLPVAARWLRCLA